MYIIDLIDLWFYLLISIIICKPEEKFGIEIPNIHSLQEAFESFQHVPKPESITELGIDLLRTAAEHADEVKSITGKCVPDYSEPCPEGWEKVGELCKATASYKGVCKTVMSFESYTPEEKVNWSNSCQANWPCKNENKDQECADSDRNYNQTCPLSFVKEKSKDSDNYICIPDPSSYIGPCNSFVDFTDFSKESKRIWAQSCGTQWPCIRNCSFVFEDCPLDWIKDSNGSCSAPTSYKGSCDKKFYFTHYTQKMKLEYLKACDIAFECSNDCKRDYTKCPNNWTNNRNGICISPTYNELCFQTYSELIGLNTTDSTDKFNKILEDERKNKPEYRIIDLNRLSYENKVMFESKCPIANFPCIENSDYDWDKPCPQHWNYINSHCIPLYINEDDDCRTKKVFKSEEEKRKWSSFCQIPWPKFGESETIVTESKKKFMLSGPVIHESGAVNVSSNLKNKTNDQLKESDYSKSIKKLNRLQVTLT